MAFRHLYTSGRRALCFLHAPVRPFFLYEMTRSQLATHHQIVNQPNATQIDALRHFGVSIAPSSDFRCLTLNSLLGSQESSKHCLDEAMDFEIIGVSNIFWRIGWRRILFLTS
jgi:hypothetical protein